MIRFEMKRMMLGFLILFMLAVAVSCISPSRKCNHSLAERLVVAWQAQESAAIPLVRQVLEDAVAKNYCYDMTTRADAFDLIDSLKLTELIPLLREVAAIDYKHQRDFQQTWDLTSIGRALSALTEFRDPTAVELNRRRLRSDTWLQVPAVENLRELGAWENTMEIASLLGSQPDADHLLLTSEIVAFLAQSPETPSGICPRLASVAPAYDDCFTEPNAAWRCGKLAPSTRVLDEKFRCGIAQLGRAQQELR